MHTMKLRMKLKGQHMIVMLMYVPLPCWHAVQIANKPYIHRQATSKNIFDNIPALAKPTRSELHDELAVFLSTDPEHVDNVLAWSYDRRTLYPHLYQMVLDYLSLPGDSAHAHLYFVPY
jgi:hypothetical protein